MATYFIIAAVAYMLGSIPFGYLLVKLFLKRDIRATGSGNIGATNVGRTGHKALAIATLLLDAGKGFAAVAFAWLLVIESDLPTLPPHGVLILQIGSYKILVLAPWTLAKALAALASICGHLFPIWLGFKGGKGVATGVGAFLPLAPLAILASAILFFVVLAIFRYVSLASITASASFPILAILFPPASGLSPGVLLLMALCSGLIMGKHHSNIRRLVAGTEPRLGKQPMSPRDEVEKRA